MLKSKMIRLVIISDTHGLHHGLKKFGDLPEGDILIHAGDVSNIGEIYDIERFVNWFASQPFDQKVFIAGNHDHGFETMGHACKTIVNETKDKGWGITYLQDNDEIINDLKFWGSPVTSPFNNWAFNREQDYRQQLWETIPEEIDILLTHGPPRDILDFSIFGHEHVGCPYLRMRVFKIKPIVHIFGHIHHSYGIKEEDGILFINASTLNERYVVTNKPVVVDVDLENRTAKVVS
jgi:Icc-related predicted phosphoesterase